MDFAVAALQLVPLVVQTGEDIVQFVAWAVGVANNPDGPTDDDWNTLEQKEAAYRAQIAAQN
ncbi:MAG TPA: hypothetical protein VMF53_15975 [Alphaproteobacteria bacterium]|nr:hypothetical protein [Alphaproteobacteria bacterium]